MCVVWILDIMYCMYPNAVCMYVCMYEYVWCMLYCMSDCTRKFLFEYSNSTIQQYSNISLDYLIYDDADDLHCATLRGMQLFVNKNAGSLISVCLIVLFEYSNSTIQQYSNISLDYLIYDDVDDLHCATLRGMQLFVNKNAGSLILI